LHGKNATIVKSRIARDEAALHQAAYAGSQSYSRSSSWSGGRLLTLGLGIMLAFARAATNGCDSHTESTYTPPAYQYQAPTDYHDYSKDLEQLRQNPEYQRLLEQTQQPAEDPTPP
jgi:hypothetical protein